MRFIVMCILFSTHFLQADILDDYYLFKGNDFLEDNKYELSLANFEKIKNKNDKIFYNMANILYILEEHDKAIIYYKKVKDISLLHQVNHNMANTYAKLEDFEQVISYNEKALNYKKDEKTKFNLELARLKNLYTEKSTLKDKTYKNKTFLDKKGKLFETNKDTLFEDSDFDEDTLLSESKRKKNNNDIEIGVFDYQDENILIKEKLEELDSNENNKLLFNTYFEQKWNKSININKTNTLLIPLEKGIINDNKKPW